MVVARKKIYYRHKKVEKLFKEAFCKIELTQPRAGFQDRSNFTNLAVRDTLSARLVLMVYD